MNAPKLLPCPFCGAENQTWQNVRDGRGLGCSKCGAGFIKYNGPPDNTAESRLVSAWNTRADLLTAMTAERDALLDALNDYISDTAYGGNVEADTAEIARAALALVNKGAINN